MDIMEIWNSYQKNADPEIIFPMYQECALEAKAEGYGDVNLLQIASQNAHPEAVAWLLEQGLKPNEVSGYGDLPLFLLAKKGFSRGYLPRKGDIRRTALALLDGGASPLRRDSAGMFCYHRAAQEGNEEFLRALAERGVKLNKTDREGNTGLHLIAQSCRNPLEDLERVNEEIEDKRKEDSLPVKQRSPISMEELERRRESIQGKLEDLFRCAVILLDAGVDPEAENDMLETAHTLAVRAGAKKLAALLDGSFSPGEEDSPEGQKKIAAGGMTLHQAVRKGDGEPDANAVNLSGKTAMDYAMERDNTPLVKLLLPYME